MRGGDVVVLGRVLVVGEMVRDGVEVCDNDIPWPVALE